MNNIYDPLYREASKEDLKEILEMRNRVKARIIAEGLPMWLNGYPQDHLISLDIENKDGRVLIVDNKIVAYASLHSIAEYPENTFLKNHLLSFSRIMVDDGYTGLKLGNVLITQMIREAKEKKYSGMGILVDDFNKRALHLYLKHGFIFENHSHFPYGDLDVYGLYF